MTSNDHGTTTDGAAQALLPAVLDFDRLYSDHLMRDAVADLIAFKIMNTPDYSQNCEAYKNLSGDTWDDSWAVVARGIDPYVVMMACYGDIQARKLMEAQVALMLHSVRLRHYWEEQDHQPAYSEQQG